MRSRDQLAVGVAILLMGTGCAQPEIPASVIAHFQSLESVEFLTVHPQSVEEQATALPEFQRIRQTEQDPYGAGLKPLLESLDRGFGFIDGFIVLDSEPISNVQQIMEHVLRADRQNNSVAASCFNPRHAIRDPSDHENYLLLCFECLQMKYQVGTVKGQCRIAESEVTHFNVLADQLGMDRDGKGSNE